MPWRPAWRATARVLGWPAAARERGRLPGAGRQRRLCACRFGSTRGVPCEYGPPGGADPVAQRRRASVRLAPVSNKVKKNALRAGTVTAGTALMMLLSSPAFALTRDDGDDPGSGLSVAQTLGLYVGLPVLLFLVISGLVVAAEKTGKKDN